MFHAPSCVTSDDIYVDRIARVDNDYGISIAAIQEIENKFGALSTRRPEYAYVDAFLNSSIDKAAFIAIHGMFRAPIKIECECQHRTGQDGQEKSVRLKRSNPKLTEKLAYTKEYLGDTLLAPVFNNTVQFVAQNLVQKYAKSELLAKALTTIPVIRQGTLKVVDNLMVGPVLNTGLSKVVNTLADGYYLGTTVTKVARSVIKDVYKKVSDEYKKSNN